jgi:hypothetical protein
VDNTSFAYVEAPAALALSTFIESPEGATDGVLSAGQEFVLAARVDNHGGAEVSTSGRLALALPAGFALVTGETETFFTPASVLHWTLRAPQEPTAGAESLLVRLAALPADQNSGEPAQSEPSTAVLSLEVHAAGGLAATLRVAGPSGARDGRLSTAQPFDLEVVATSNAELTGRQAELVLPAAWDAPAGQPAKRDLPDEPTSRLVWTVTAPSTPGSYQLVLRVTATDPNDESARVATDTLALEVERAARLALGASIVSPEEAADGRLLPGTVFQLRARVRNQGVASVHAGDGDSTHGSVRLADLPEGYVVADRVREFTLDGAGVANVLWTITAPSDYRPAVETLRLVFERLPADANSDAAVAVDPDSSAARCIVSLTAGDLQVETEAMAAALAAPGQARVPLLRLRLTNDCEHAVSLDSLGACALVDGALAAQSPFSKLFLVRDDAPAETLAVRVAGQPAAWFRLQADDRALLVAGSTSRWTLLADLAADAPSRRVGLSLRQSAASEPMLRAFESRSRTRVPVRAASGTTLAGDPLRIVAGNVAAYNAPNPFHAEREITTIHYQVDAPGDVQVSIHTLQGALVWETRRHEETSGPSLRGVEWDGRNGVGQPVRNGVYICDVQAGGRSTRIKIAVVR